MNFDTTPTHVTYYSSSDLHFPHVTVYVRITHYVISHVGLIDVRWLAPQFCMFGEPNEEPKTTLDIQIDLVNQL